MLTEIIGAIVVIYLLEGRIGRAYEEMGKEVKVLKTTWDNALHAWERGEIPERKIVESQQWASWYKWIHQGDATGWAELIEQARYGNGLADRLRSAAEWELERLQRRAYESGGYSEEEEKMEENLQVLLHSPSGNLVDD